MTYQVKGNYETVGVSAKVEVGDCAAQQVHKYKYKYSMTNMENTNTAKKQVGRDKIKIQFSTWISGA